MADTSLIQFDALNAASTLANTDQTLVIQQVSGVSTGRRATLSQLRSHLVRPGNNVSIDPDGVINASSTSWLHSSGVPSNGTGANYDYNLDIVTGNVYQKTLGAWNLIGSIKGATGSSGTVSSNSGVTVGTTGNTLSIAPGATSSDPVVITRSGTGAIQFSHPVSLSSTLAIAGTTTAAAITASGTITGNGTGTGLVIANAATIGTTLTVGGTTTLLSTSTSPLTIANETVSSIVGVALTVPSGHEMALRVPNGGRLRVGVFGSNSALIVQPNTGLNTPGAASPSTVTVGNVLSAVAYQNPAATYDLTGKSSVHAVSNLAMGWNTTGATYTGTTADALHQFAISADTADITPDAATGAGVLLIQHTVGGGAARGGRVPLRVALTQAGAIGVRGDMLHAIGKFTSSWAYSQGGTDLTTGAVGTVQTLRPQITLNSGATNYAEVAAWGEAGLAIRSGASVRDAIGIGVTLLAAHRTAASRDNIVFAIDGEAIAVDGVGATATWRQGIAFGTRDRRWAMASTAELITANFQTNNGDGAALNAILPPPLATRGLAFGNVNFSQQSGHSIHVPGASIDGTGQFRSANLFIKQVAGGIEIDIPLSKVSAVSVSTAGTGAAGVGNYYPGDILYAELLSGVRSQYRVTNTKVLNARIVAGGGSGTPGAVTVTGTTGTGTKFQASGIISAGGVLVGNQVLSAAVVAGGTGGTPGAVTLTGTTGTGTRFQATGTINGSGVLTGALTVTVVGAYTAAPTNVAAEPVTGGGLTGATVSLVMVPTVTVAGSYTVNPTNSAVEPVTGGSLVGATVSLGIGLNTVSVLVPDVSAAAPGTITVSGGSGSGAVLTPTWAAANTLSLNTSGGLTEVVGTLAVGRSSGTSSIIKLIGDGTGERGAEYYTGADRRALLSLSDLVRMRLRMYNTSGSSPYTIWDTRYQAGTTADPHQFNVGPDATTATVAFDVSGNIRGRSFTSYSTALTLSGSTTLAPLVNIKQSLAGTSSYTGSYGLTEFGTNSDTLAVNSGGVYYLSGLGQLKAGQTGGRVGVYGLVLRNEATTLVDGGDGSVGVSGHATSNVTAGGSSSGLGLTQFGMGNHWGLFGKARLSGTATGYRSAIGMELNATVADSATVASVVGLQIVHESDHARGAPRWGANIGVGIASQNLTAGPSYSDKGWDIGWAWGAVSGGVWPFRSDAVLAQVRAGFAAGTTYPNDCAGFIDGLQGNFTGTSPGGGGFLFRGAGVRVNPGNSFGGEIQVGAASLRGTSGGAELDLNYQQVTAVTVTTGGTLWSTNDMAEDVYGNLYKVTAQSAGVITAISLIRSGWRTATVGTPVAITAVNRGGTAYGTGATVTLSTWTPRTELLIQGSGGATVLGGTWVSGGRAMTGSSAASLTVPAYITDTTGAITYNSRFRSSVLANSGPTEHYTTLHQGVIPAGSTLGRMVPGYFQGQNLASGAASYETRVVWGVVAEARDDSTQPSSTGAVLLGLEIDIEAAGLDDHSTNAGRRGAVVIFSKTDAAVSMEGSYAFQAFTGTSAKIKTSYKASATHTQSVFDTRESTLDAGAHGLWFATGHDIALDTSANTKISSDATTISVTGAATLSSTLAVTGSATAASIIVTGSSVPATTGIYLPAANTLGMAVNGAGEVQLTSSALSPMVSGGNALGTTTLMWGGVFLANGTTINFAAGNLTLTHSTGVLTNSGLLASASFVPTGSTIPVNGMYLSAANTLGLAVNSTGEVQLTSVALSPITAGGNALGTTSLPWAGVVSSAQILTNMNATTAPINLAGTVYRAVAADSTSSYFLGDAFGAPWYFASRRSGGTNAAPTALASGNIIGGIIARGYDGTAYSTASASVTARADEAWTSTAHGTAIVLATTTAGTTTEFDRLVLDSAGAATFGPSGNTYKIAPSTATGTAIAITGAGTGGMTMGTSGGVQLAVTHTASAVNYVSVTGAGTGNAPKLSAVGSDAVIHLRLAAKSSGSIIAENNIILSATRVLVVDTLQVVGPRDTGWTAMTGTADEVTSYATSSITLAQLAGRVMALQTALTTHGLIGP